jgi:DNA-directed RNA polymerase subunit alpha
MDPILLPNQAVTTDLGDNKYQVTLEPLYPGYGVTIGNTLRRVLLSSMPGAAVTAVKIKFVDHEFSTIPNVKEDVIQIILNLKRLRLRSHSPEPVRLQVKVKGEAIVTAADIKETDQVEIINKDLHLATLDNKNAEFDMELIVEQGRGYVPVEARENEKNEVGLLSIDAIYTPVKSVYFDVSNVRVGQLTNFDKLDINMETDGTITGQEAIEIAANILVDHFSTMFGKPAGQIEAPSEEAEETGEDMPAGLEAAVEPVGDTAGAALDTLTLSNRARNALNRNGIMTVPALEALSNEEINNIPGLGEKTIAEILEALGRNIA